MNGYAKRHISLRYWLLGKGWHMALDAMEFGAQHHTGTRKDKITPEFDHQITIAHYVRTIEPWLIHPQETMATVFLHDTREDYHVSDEEVRLKFGALVADATDCLTKEYRGVRLPEDVVWEKIANNPIASIVKGGDRIHNQDSMVGVFSQHKQSEYIAETEQHILPMLKLARRRFAQQEGAYENIKLVLKNQVKLVKASLSS